jgi:hypothetical protein
VRRFALAAYFVEAGLLLVVLPWSVFWEQNYLFDVLPGVRAVTGSAFVRGGVTGLGLWNLGIGLSELGGLLISRLGDQPTPDDASIAPPSQAR